MRFPFQRYAKAILLGILLLGGGFLPPQALAANLGEIEASIGQQKQELARLRSDLEAGRKHLKELSDQARGQAEAVRQLESNLALQQRILHRLDSTEALYRKLLESSAREADDAVKIWKERRSLLENRVVSLYKHGRPRPGQAWIGNRDPGTWLRILQGLRAVIRSDEELLRSVKSREASAREAIAAHRTRLAGLDEVVKARKSEVASLEQDRQEGTRRLQTLEERQAEETRRLEQLEASQAMLEKILTNLEAKRKAEQERRIAEEKARKEALERARKEAERRRKEEEAKRRLAEEAHRKEVERSRRENRPPPAPLPPPPVRPKDPPVAATSPPAPAPEGLAPGRNSLCWPVKGKVLSSFGLHKNPVLGTVTRNLGVEIQGQGGQSVVSAAKGTVAATTKLPGRGSVVILQHAGGYFSIYGHLDRIEVSTGQTIEACSEIASLDGGDPARVYFEYRHNLKAEDPLEWLKR